MFWLSLLATSNLETLAAPATNKYKLLPWSGDDFTRGHQLRNGDVPKLPDKVEKTVDFIIVGGGLAGLTSAYYLRDHNFLLLEQYDQLGGQSRNQSYRGLDYPLGASCVSSLEGIFGKLYAELNLKPVTMPPSRNSFYWEQQWIPGIDGNDQSIVHHEFTKLADNYRSIWANLIPNGIEIPCANQDILKLDSSSFASSLQEYDPKFLDLLNSICKSMSCGNTSQISLLAGIDLIKGLFEPSYVFKGGNGAITKALNKSIGQERCQSGAFVWSVDLLDNGASVVYSDANGQMHRVNCKYIIVTTPPLVSARQINNLPDITKALLFSSKFGSYLVANFCMKKQIFNHTYDSWVGNPFTFSSIAMAEAPYKATNSYKADMGSVMTVYQPYIPGSEGRPLLLEGNRETIATSLIKQLSSLAPQFENNLEQIAFTRWGHALAVPTPGTFSRLNKLHSLNNGPLTLAHSSMFGMPSAEAAITAARFAANQALKI